MNRTLFLIFPCILLLAACSDQADIPTAVSPSGETGTLASTAKGGGNDMDSRAVFTFHDVLPDGTNAVIQGDGKGPYQGDTCGIRGRIFWYNWEDSPTGDAVLDPDFKRDARCPDWPRQLLINNTPTGPYMNIMNIMNDPNRTDPSDPGSPLLPGRVAITWIDGAVVNDDGMACEGLRYQNDNDTGAIWVEVRKSVRGTNPANSTPGLWEVYSDPSKGHRARCSSGQGPVGLAYAPFHVTVEEVFVF